MSSSDYRFLSHWRVIGTVEEVSDILGRPEDLARWWPSVYLEAQLLDPGDERGIGRRVRVLTKGFLPYTLSWQFLVVESSRPHGFAIEATGDFVGRGVWTFEQQGAWVGITFDWKISVEKPGVKELSPVLRPLFAANHRWAMRRGEESLKRELARRRGEAAGGAGVTPRPRPSTALPWPLVLGCVAVALGAIALAALVAQSRRRGRRRRWRPKRRG